MVVINDSVDADELVGVDPARCGFWLRSISHLEVQPDWLC